jgi:hypothetical protein
MKIRSGFVSNSSSSSFVALLSAKDFEAIKDSLSILDAAVVSAVGVEQKQFLGNDCVSFGYISGNYSTLENMGNDEIMDHAQKIANERGESLPDDFEERISDESYESLRTCRDKIQSLSNDKRFIHHEDF